MAPSPSPPDVTRIPCVLCQMQRGACFSSLITHTFCIEMGSPVFHRCTAGFLTLVEFLVVWFSQPVQFWVCEVKLWLFVFVVEFLVFMSSVDSAAVCVLYCTCVFECDSHFSEQFSLTYSASIPFLSLSIFLLPLAKLFEAVWSGVWFTVLTANPSRPVGLYAITAALTDLNDSKPDTLKLSHSSRLIIPSLDVRRHLSVGQVCNWINACDVKLELTYKVSSEWAYAEWVV